MPNHVTNRVTVTGDAAEIQRFYDKAITIIEEGYNAGEKSFDFNAFIPMPEEIRDTQSSSVRDMGLALLGYETRNLERMMVGDFGSVRKSSKRAEMYRMLGQPWAAKQGLHTPEQMEAHIRKEHPKAEELGRKAVVCLEKYGSMDWYDWAVDNWGTKWNSYSYGEDRLGGGCWEFKFDTAWSTPDPIFDALFQEFPTLRFEIAYFDEGWNFAGTLVKKAGCVAQEVKADTDDEQEMADLYERVYGYPPESDEDEDEAHL
jgi:hypothetical protein